MITPLLVGRALTSCNFFRVASSAMRWVTAVGECTTVRASLPGCTASSLIMTRAPASMPGHVVVLDPAKGGPAHRLVELLGRSPFAPPSLPEAMREAGAGPEVLRALAKDGSLVRLSEDVAFTREQLDRFDACLAELAAAGHRPALVHAANSAGTIAHR